MIALGLTLLAATAAAPKATAPAKPARPVPELVGDVLAEKRFTFCRDPRYPLTAEELRLCPFAKKPDRRCPAFAEACRRGVGAVRREPPKIEAPDWNLSSAWRWAAFGLLGAAVVALAHALLGNVRWRRPRARPREAAAPAAVSTEVSIPAEVEADVERLLAAARAAAASGDYARAILSLHAALLRKLEGAGLLAVHPSRTNGDYLRALAAARPALAPPVRAIVRDVESVQFGAAAPSSQLFTGLLARVLQLGPLALLLAFVTLVPGCQPDRGGWDESPSGRAAVIALLERAGRQVHERFTPVAKLGAADAVVLLPGADLADADWQRLHAWVRDEGGLLVVAGGPRPLPSWLSLSVFSPKNVSAEVVATIEAWDELGGLRLTLPITLAFTLATDDRPLLRREPQWAPYAFERELEEGTILALADDRLFTNAALLFADNALAVVRLLGKTRRIEFVGELTGLVAPNPVASVTRGRMAPFLGQLGLVIAAFFLFRGVAFGRLREPIRDERRSFVEHVQALGEHYARAEAARHALAAYGQYAIERLRERVGLSGAAGLIPLAEAVGARVGRPPGEVMRLLVEAREAGEAIPGADQSAQHARRVAAEIEQLMKDIGRGAAPGRSS